MKTYAAILALLVTALPSMAASEMLPPNASQALAEMDFPRLKRLLKEDGRSDGYLDVCDAMERSFQAACTRLKSGSWKPVLVDMRGKIVDVSRSGLSFRSSGMSMVIPWRTITALRRQKLLAEGMPQPDADAWIARVSYAVWSGLADRAGEEMASAKRAGEEMPAWLSLAADMLARTSEPEPPVRPSTRRTAGNSRTSSRSSGGKGLLGSADFRPSPAHPVGWRGDGSGRFPGATPPTRWGRRVVDSYSQIMTQAAKPKGKPGADSHRLAYFTIKEWLVAGPFPANPTRDMDTDLIGGEASAMPDVGMKAGGARWKAHRACEATQPYHEYNAGTCSDMYVDFLYALGKLVPPEKPYPQGYGSAVYAPLENQAAYAHTYLYSPRAVDMDIDILHQLPAVKVWVNGVPQLVGEYKMFEHKPIKIRLNQGWNRLLIKAICANATGKKYESKWRFAAHLMPAGHNLNSPGGHGRIGPMAYATENISWMTKLTGRSASQPIVVGDRAYVGSGTSDLACIDMKTGRIVWLHTVSYWDAMTREERAAIKDKAAPALQAVEKANADVIAAINAGISPQGLDSAGQKAIDAKLQQRDNLIKALHNAVASGTKGRLYMNEVAASNAAPASDGTNVYWLVQSNGGFLPCAFDLDGKLIWAHLERKSGAGEHGSHRSPALCQNRLIAPTNDELIGYDARTGKELWRTPGASHQHGVDGGPIMVTLGGQQVIQTSKNMVGLDGRILSDGGYPGWGAYLPVVENGMLYNSCHLVGWSDWPFEVYELKTGVKPKLLWSLDAKTLRGPVGDNPFHVASPLYVAGLLYQVDGYGHLEIIDTRQRKVAVSRWMDGYNWNNRYLYGYCASPAFAGKQIYFVDVAGYATIMEPGPGGTVLGNNILENATNLPGNGPCRQEVFYAGMYFSGSKLLLHGDEYLYCIEEK